MSADLIKTHFVAWIFVPSFRYVASSMVVLFIYLERFCTHRTDQGSVQQMDMLWCLQWWNPTIEEQAIARAHQIGQTRTVHVTRITIAGSEPHILFL